MGMGLLRDLLDDANVWPGFLGGRAIAVTANFEIGLPCSVAGLHGLEVGSRGVWLAELRTSVDRNPEVMLAEDSLQS